jgi:hypothetical protein
MATFSGVVDSQELPLVFTLTLSAEHLGMRASLI